MLRLAAAAMEEVHVLRHPFSTIASQRLWLRQCEADAQSDRLKKENVLFKIGEELAPIIGDAETKRATRFAKFSVTLKTFPNYFSDSLRLFVRLNANKALLVNFEKEKNQFSVRKADLVNGSLAEVYCPKSYTKPELIEMLNTALRDAIAEHKLGVRRRTFMAVAKGGAVAAIFSGALWASSAFGAEADPANDAAQPEIPAAHLSIGGPQ